LYPKTHISEPLPVKMEAHLNSVTSDKQHSGNSHQQPSQGDTKRGPDMELRRGRTAAEILSPNFHPSWAPQWPREFDFGFE
jgi:hypothetical protein